jgi:hypothetical protein
VEHEHDHDHDDEQEQELQQTFLEMAHAAPLADAVLVTQRMIDGVESIVVGFLVDRELAVVALRNDMDGMLAAGTGLRLNSMDPEFMERAIDVAVRAQKAAGPASYQIPPSPEVVEQMLKDDANREKDGF